MVVDDFCTDDASKFDSPVIPRWPGSGFNLFAPLYYVSFYSYLLLHAVVWGTAVRGNTHKCTCRLTRTHTEAHGHKYKYEYKYESAQNKRPQKTRVSNKIGGGGESGRIVQNMISTCISIFLSFQRSPKISQKYFRKLSQENRSENFHDITPNSTQFL